MRTHNIWRNKKKILSGYPLLSGPMPYVYLHIALKKGSVWSNIFGILHEIYIVVTHRNHHPMAILVSTHNQITCG